MEPLEIMRLQEGGKAFCENSASLFAAIHVPSELGDMVRVAQRAIKPSGLLYEYGAVIVEFFMQEGGFDVPMKSMVGVCCGKSKSRADGVSMSDGAGEIVRIVMNAWDLFITAYCAANFATGGSTIAVALQLEDRG